MSQRELTPEQLWDRTHPVEAGRSVHHRDEDSTLCRSAVAVGDPDASTYLRLNIFRPEGAAEMVARRHTSLNSWGGWHFYWECEDSGEE